MLSGRVLGRRRFVIHVSRVEVRATVDKGLRDLDRPRAVQRRLPVAATRMDERRLSHDQVAQPIEQAQVCRRKDVDNSAALDQRRRLLGRAVVFEQAEPAAHPCALEIEIRPCAPAARRASQVFLGSATGRLSSGLMGLFTAARTSAYSSCNSRTRAQSSSCSAPRNRSTGVLVSESILCFMRPAFETVAAGDDQLRISKRERLSHGRLRVQRADPRQRLRIAGQAARSSSFAPSAASSSSAGRARFDKQRLVGFGLHETPPF